MAEPRLRPVDAAGDRAGVAMVFSDHDRPAGVRQFEEAKHIRALPASKNRVPTVAMTANVLPQQVTQLLAAGMDDHVGKPFKQDELRELASLWRRRRRRLR